MNRKFLIALIVALLCYDVSQSQSIESIFSERKNCAEIDLVAMDVIPGYYHRQELDSIEIILDFVGYKCIESPVLRLTRFLLLIEQHRFSDTILTPLDLHYIKKESQYLQKGHLYDFFLMDHSPLSIAPVEGNGVFWRRSDIERSYIMMLKSWTNKLAERNDNDPLESAVISHLQSYDSEMERPGLWGGISSKKNGYLSLPFTYNKYHRDFVILNSWQVTVGAGGFLTT